MMEIMRIGCICLYRKDNCIGKDGDIADYGDDDDEDNDGYCVYLS